MSERQAVVGIVLVVLGVLPLGQWALLRVITQKGWAWGRGPVDEVLAIQRKIGRIWGWLVPVGLALVLAGIALIVTA